MSTAEAASSGAAEKQLPGCVVMAAGAARRFGENKLLTKLGGRPLYRHILDALPLDAFSRVAVVSGTWTILEEAAKRGFLPIINVRPEEGPSRTIRLGLQRMLDLPACLFCVADQPKILPDTIRRIAQGPAERIRAASYRGIRGNPVLFPAILYGELLHLPIGSGGSAVVRKHPEMLSLIPCSQAELADIDTPQDMWRLVGRSH